ncbi:hypothetical protein DFH09DRAFT_1333862 [Mycena vulgaris]|nr:hypothetical protein DFH09DRAFT_1333862 [Mycena vulgaris]
MLTRGPPGKEETNLAAIACVLALPRAALQWALLGFVVVLALPTFNANNYGDIINDC